MNAEFEKYHLIDRYFRKELNPEEQTAFEKQLQGDPAFAEEVEYQKGVNELISAASFHELRQQMSRDIEARESKIRSRKWLGGFLVFVIAGLTGLLILNSDYKKTATAIQKEKTKIAASENEGIATAALVDKTSKEIPESPHSEPAIKPGLKMDTTSLSPASALPQKVETEEAVESEDTLTTKNINKQDERKKSDQKYSPKENEPLTPSRNLPDKKDLEVIDDTDSQPSTKNICDGVKITSSWSVEKACQNENTGAIQLDESAIRGGNGPYQIELSKGKVQISDTQFSSLYSGTYTLKVTDATGCTEKWDIFVAEKPCRQKEVSISPAHGETWEFNGDEGESYYLSILNQSGQMVYKSLLLSGTTSWDGTGNLGAPVETGLHIYILEYTNGKKLKGQITIIR